MANLFGSTLLDVIFGTLATLLACLVTWKLRSVRLKAWRSRRLCRRCSSTPSIVGAEITLFFTDYHAMSAPLWLLCLSNGISVGVGELISCTVLGVALVKLIESNAALRRAFTEA